MNDQDRTATWLAGIDSELTESLWAPDGLTVDDETAGPGLAGGGLVSLAFIRDALRRAAWLWCATALLGLLIGSGLYLRYPPDHHAQTSVLLVDETNQDPAVEVLTDQSLAESEPVAARVVKELGLQESVASFQAAYTVTADTDTVLTFNVGARSSAAAVQRASALATSYLQYRAEYAQSQEQEQIAQLTAQYNAAQQRLYALDAQINQMPSGQLTSAQKVQLDNLETQQGDQKQIMQYVTGTEAASKTATDEMVSGSYVLDSAAPLAYSHLKGVALYVLGGLVIGLAVGMAIVIISALLSSRLRRRDDVAAALGAPVRLSVGRLRLPRRLPVSPWQAAKRDLDMDRVIAHLQGAVPGSSRGPASLAVVAVDDAQTVASAVASLARSCAEEGRRVVVADLSSRVVLAQLLGASDPGVHEVSHDGVRLLVAVPELDDVAPIGPLLAGSSAAVSARPDEAVVTACSGADLLLTLVTLDPALGGDHLATWATDAIVTVTAGRSSAEKVHGVGEMIRLAGTRLDSAILIGADRNDESLGIIDSARPTVGAAQPGKSERSGDGVPPGGRDLGDPGPEHGRPSS